MITGIDVDPKTGDVWLGLFGRGLARFTGGRFDHFHQLNSGLVNDVVYAVTMENDNVWAATTAGASRYNTKTKEWTIFTEKNAPMEEIWNYNVAYDQADRQSLSGGLGQRCAGVRLPARSRGKLASRGRSISIPTTKWKSTCIVTTGSFT